MYLPAEPALSSAQSREAQALTAKLQLLIDSSSGQVQSAIKAMIWRIAAHPKQRLEDGQYTELAIGYIAKAAGTGWETARRAWHLVAPILRWSRLSAAEAIDAGVNLREKIKGSMWGQHLAVSDAAIAASIRACTFEEPHLALPDAPGWMPVEPIKRGRHLVCSCPWHEDRNPSMVLYPNEDGRSGSAVCFACRRDGRALSAYWRCDAGIYRMRLPHGAKSPSSLGLGTIHNQTGEPPSGGMHIYRSPGVGTGRASGSLFDILARQTRPHADPAEALARSERLIGFDPRSMVPDRYISLDEMEPVEWAESRARPGVRYPTRWEPVRMRFVAVDLDGFRDAPVGDDSLTHAGRELVRRSMGHALLSGAVAIIRTSHFGIQVVFELAQATHPAWKRTEESRQLHDEIEAWSLAMAEIAGFDGGHVDPTARGIGRMIRRPGPRLCKMGLPYVSRMVFLERDLSRSSACS